MEGDFEEDSRQRLTVDIRILSGKKKSSFRTARVKGFPVAETREEFQNEVQKILPGEKFTKNFSFGFIDKNKKIWVVSDSEVSDAYAAAINGQALWVDPNHTVAMDEVETSKEKHGKKRKRNFANKSTCLPIFSQFVLD